MSVDVEIIEDVMQIIEISDDESLYEEDRKDLLVLPNVSEEVCGKKTIANESPDVQAKIHGPNPRHADITSSQIMISPPISTVNTKKQYVNLEGKHTKSVNSSNVACVENPQLNTISRQTNNINTDNQQVSLNDNSVESINTTHSNETISKNSPSNRKLRVKRKRGRRRIKKQLQNTRVEIRQCRKVLKTVQKTPTIQNISNKDGQNESADSTVVEQATCSSNVMTATCINTRSSESYNLSKLNWLKPLSNLTSPPHLQIVIIDRSHPDWKIANEKWLMIEKRLLEALNSEMLRTNETSIGLFDGAKWQRGIKIVGCHNENAFDFIMKFIMNLDKLWFGAKLDAFPISYISRHIVKVYIPPPTLKTELIMSLIKLQNPSIVSKDWKVIRERERPCNGGVDIWISINNDSFHQLCRLRGEIKYGINRIWLNPSQ